MHPNSSLLYSLAATTGNNKLSANVLHPEGIAELLQNYPNWRFVDTLTSIATNSAQVGYTGSLSGQTCHSTHASPAIHSDIVTNAIRVRISKGRVKEITGLPSDYFCSPIGLVPKLLDVEQIGWRVIFDPSSEGTKKLRLPLTAPILLRVLNGIRNDEGVNLKSVLCRAFAAFL